MYFECLTCGGMIEFGHPCENCNPQKKLPVMKQAVFKIHFLKVEGLNYKRETILCGIGGEKYKSDLPTSTEISDVTCGNCKKIYERLMSIYKR